MARKPKNVALDRQQEKAKKQKRTLIALMVVLGLALVYEVPKTMKLMQHSASAPVVEAAGTPAAATPTTTPTPPPAAATAAAAAASAVAPKVSIVSAVEPTVDPGQLTEFARFASKDPFDPKIANSSSALPTSTSTTAKKTAPTLPAMPKAPPAPPVTSAVISLNGELMSVAVNSDFPTTGTVFSQVGAPLFHLISLTEKTAKIAIAGGSYADGSAAITLKVGTPVTLQNTADGSRYTLLLEPQGTQVPTSTTATSTSPTTTTPSIVPATP